MARSDYPWSGFKRNVFPVSSFMRWHAKWGIEYEFNSIRGKVTRPRADRVFKEAHSKAQFCKDPKAAQAELVEMATRYFYSRPKR